MDNRVNLKDRRVVRTRAAVVAALDTLLMEKKISQITVTDIAREANVDRKTFYAHFGSIDGLVDYYLEMEMTAAYEEILARLDKCEEMGNVEILRESLPVIGEMLKKSRVLNSRDVSLASAQKLVYVLRDTILRVVEKKGGLFPELDEDVRDCILSFTILGTAAVYRCAAVDHPSMSRDKAAELAVNLVAGGLQSYQEGLAG